MEYDRIALGRLAREQGFVRDTPEKVCRLTDILLFIQRAGHLNTGLSASTERRRGLGAGRA